jgi:hypothetical protein
MFTAIPADIARFGHRCLVMHGSGQGAAAPAQGFNRFWASGIWPPTEAPRETPGTAAAVAPPRRPDGRQRAALPLRERVPADRP